MNNKRPRNNEAAARSDTAVEAEPDLLKGDRVMFKLADECRNEPSIAAFNATAADTQANPSPLRLVVGHQVDQTGTAPAKSFVRGGLPPRVLRRVREHIDAHIEKRVSVEALAGLANLSVCYFVRAFKQSVGVTPHDYLIRRRVERTMELLSSTDMPLSEIALAAGFSDQSHCARRFRQHVGMSPRGYRWSIP
jgi:transcriptional regulator GlxA family with amidase domain